MATLAARDLDVEEALAHLHEDGYVVLEGLLTPDELRMIRNDAAELFARERADPYEPQDGPESPDDIELNEYFAKTYNISEAEQARVMRRVRHTRALNHGTPWPVPPGRMNKGFLHLPTLFDNDASQRVLNLPNKLDACGRLIEDPTVLRLTRSVLDEDWPGRWRSGSQTPSTVRGPTTPTHPAGPSCRTIRARGSSPSRTTRQRCPLRSRNATRPPRVTSSGGRRRGRNGARG